MSAGLMIATTTITEYDDDDVRFLKRDAMLVQYMLSSCVYPSVCLSVTSRSFTKMAKPGITQITYHTIVQGLQFSDAKNLGEIPTGSPPAGIPNRSGVGYSRLLLTST